MSDWPDHVCAACGAARKPFPRYPWHLCNDCCKSAVDAHGRKLDFFNTHASGGFGFSIAGVADQYTCRGVIALIASRPAYISEARFGGVVAQPVLDRGDIPRGAADLTSKVNPPENLTVWNPKRGKSGGISRQGRG